MSDHRIEKLQEEIRAVIGSLILFEVTDPLIQKIAITHVLVTKDVGLARIYYETNAPEAEKREIQESLTKAAGFFRRQLASKIRLRQVPQIHFFYDETSDEIQRVEGLFAEKSAKMS